VSAPAAKTRGKSPVIRLTEEQGASLMRMAIAVAAVGILLGVLAAFSDHERFAAAYLTGFVFVTTVGLGAMFFVLIQHLTRAGWSVGPRRQMEWLSGILPVSAALFLPVAIHAHDLYREWMGPEAANDEVLRGKAAYLNPTFFYIRAVVFLAAWTGLALWFWRTSRKQDESGDPALTEKMQLSSAPGVVVFSLTLTFAAFDWVMSLDPHWYSTIFGVYIFAGSATSSLAALALMTLALQSAGIMGKVSTVEHRHDIGKLLFGFIVFWAYIGFSQFLLIWYANIPEETIFYVHRLEGSWKTVSLTLLFGHFVVPFIVLLSRHAKRHPGVLGLASVLMLVMHYVDIYWLVMPNFLHEEASLSWIDLAGLLGPLGIGVLAVVLRARRSPVYPLRDPRLEEAMHVENL
jgi:hypothetical protein